MGDPAFPIILIADVYQSRLTPEQLVENDQYVGAQLAIAQADSNVMVINARRLTERHRLESDERPSGEFLEDGVHYTALGAKVLSAAVVAAMMGEIHVSSCVSDPGTVSLQSTMTLIVDAWRQFGLHHHGQLSVAHSLELNQPALKVALTNGFVPAAGDKFKILSFASSSGSFASVSLPQLAQGLSWNTSALYTQGTISVEVTAPPPPPTPDPPTISVTSGANQSVTLPSAPSPIAFTLSGSGTLTVSASSSNQTLLPNSGITVSLGCGQATLSCTATLTTANEQTGASTLSLTVTDTHSQTAATTATLQVAAASQPQPQPPPPGPSPEPGTGAATDRGGGGGGGLDLLFVLGLAVLLMRTPRRVNDRCLITRKRSSSRCPHHHGR